MAALITPVAGAYTGTWDADDLGIMDDNGFEISFSPKGQDINDTDQFGQTLLEGIYRGQDWRCRFKSKEWNATGIAALIVAWGVGAATAAPNPALGTIGVTYSSLSKPLILTSTAGTPAAASPATLTASQAMSSPNNNASFLMTSKVRELPLETILLPYVAAEKNVPFTTT